MLKYDIVKVKTKLDYSKAELPEEKEKKDKALKLIEKLKALEGKLFYVADIFDYNHDEPKSYKLVGLDSKLKIDKEEFDIIMLENELELIHTDYMNNCCRDYFADNFTEGEDTICPTCKFSFLSFVKSLDKPVTKS